MWKLLVKIRSVITISPVGWSSESFILVVHLQFPLCASLVLYRRVCAVVAKTNSHLWTESPPPLCGCWSFQWYRDTGQKELDLIFLRGPLKSIGHEDLPKGRLSPKKSMKGITDGRVTHNISGRKLNLMHHQPLTHTILWAICFGSIDLF